MERLKTHVRHALDPGERAKGLSVTNRVLIALIFASVAMAIIETEPTISNGHNRIFRTAELAFGILFTLEYLARFWVAGGNSQLGSPWKARLKWAISPGALIDLIATLPALIAMNFAPAYGLRLVRLIRILRFAKLGRFSKASAFISQAIYSRRYELMLTLLAALFVLIVSATLLYLVEGAIQPADFGSIPRSMWWAVVTLTTVGYGDVTPKTPLGKALAGLTALIGVGLVAAPTGILAAAFSEAIHRRHEHEAAEQAALRVER